MLVWFRNDLRTTDNEVLHAAIQKSDFIIPVYIFDPRYYTANKSGFVNTGDLRHDYIVHSVASLQNKLQSLGGDLLTYEGYPEEIIPHLVQKYDVDEVYHHREVATRETKISELVEESLWKVKRNLKHFIGHTLYHKEDLPFPIKDIPNDFNTFKKKIAKESFVRACIPDITQVTLPPHIEKTDFSFDIDTDRMHSFGEEAAQQALYKIVTNSDKKEDLYHVISAFLASGILSAMQVYHFLNDNSNAQNKKIINSILDGLLWRDYYRFMLKKIPNCYFKSEIPIQNDEIMIESFVKGETEDASINDLILKLNQEGNLKRSERELLALYFIYELKQHWLTGAAYFEQQLIDYAPATNYGFWSHIAGKGTSVKNNRSIADWLKTKKVEMKTVE